MDGQILDASVGSLKNRPDEPMIEAMKPVFPTVSSFNARRPPPAAGRTDPPAAPEALRPGAELRVRVLRVMDRAAVLLQIGREVFAARTELPLRPGTELSMRVISTTPDIVLQPRPTRRHDAQTAAVRERLAGVMPIQRPLAFTLAAMLRAFQGPGTRPATTGPLTGLLELILEVRRVGDPQALRLALARWGGAGAADVPGAALQLETAEEVLARQIRPETTTPASPPPSRTALQPAALSLSHPPASPSEDGEAGMLQLVKAARARLTLHRVASERLGAAGEPQWLFELPVLRPGGIDTVAVWMRRDARSAGRGGGAEPASWRIDLVIPVGEQTRLHARLVLEGNWRLKVTLWCPDRVLHRRASERIARLREGLETAGLEVTHLACRAGCPPALPRVETLLPRLLEARA